MHIPGSPSIGRESPIKGSRHHQLFLMNLYWGVEAGYPTLWSPDAGRWGLMHCSMHPALPSLCQRQQHFINSPVGPLQSCQHKPTPFPPGAATLNALHHSKHRAQALAHRLPSGLGYPKRILPIPGGTANTPIHTRANGFLPCCHAPHIGGSTGSPQPHRCRSWGSSKTLLLIPKTPVSFFPPQLRAGEAASEWKGRRWEQCPLDRLGGEGQQRHGPEDTEMPLQLGSGHGGPPMLQ